MELRGLLVTVYIMFSLKRMIKKIAPPQTEKSVEKTLSEQPQL